MTVNGTLNGIIHKCPYTSISIKNMTFSFYRDYQSSYSFMSENGVFKVKLHIYNNREKNIVTIEYTWKRQIIYVKN